MERAFSVINQPSTLSRAGDPSTLVTMPAVTSTITVTAAPFTEFSTMSVAISMLTMPASAAVLPPLMIRDVPLPRVDVPVVMGDSENRAGDVTAIDRPPRPVVGPRPVPVVTPRTPPEAVIKEDVELQSRHEIGMATGNEDNFRRFGNHYRRWTEVDADPDIYPRSRLATRSKD